MPFCPKGPAICKISQQIIKDVSKNLLESGEQYIVVSPFSFVFSGCLTRCVINAARIVLFKSAVKLNNFSSDKKHDL